MRTLDYKFFNEIANRETVRPYMGGEGVIDVRHLVLNPTNYAFKGEHGGFIAVKMYDGLYECHTVYDTDNPRETVRLMGKAREYMFIHTDCVELTTKVIGKDHPAHHLSRLFGFVGDHVREGVSYYKLSLDLWARTCSTPGVEGHKFHEILEIAKRNQGSELTVHEDDDLHDHMVGAAIMMVRAGNVVKGVNFYNRWAVFAGYAPVELVSEQPAVIDVQDAVMGLSHDGQLEVLLCR